MIFVGEGYALDKGSPNVKFCRGRSPLLQVRYTDLSVVCPFVVGEEDF